MASLTKYAGTVSQSTGGKFAQFSNLANIKNASEGSWATTVNIKGKSGSPNRPSTLSLTNFNVGLATGREVSKVTVEYRHKKSGSVSVGAPTISLLGVSGFSSKGVAPSKTSMVTSTKSFSGSALTRSVVNSSSFGVKIDYPTNSGTGEGTISVSYVRITVEYKVPSYSLSIKKVSGGYNNEKYTIQCAISNNALTSYSPTLTLSAPTGFSFSSASGSGTYTKVNNRTITWNPKLTSKIGTATLDLEFDVNVTYPTGQSSYSGTFTLVESLYSTTESFSATITERPSGTGEDVDPDEPLPDGGEVPPEEQMVVNVIAGNDFVLDLEDKIGDHRFVYLDFIGMSGDDISYDGNYFSKGGTPYCYIFYGDDNFPIDGNWVITNPQKYMVGVRFTGQIPDGYTIKFYINVMPPEEDLTVPFFTVLEPSEEEINRLGTGYTYIAQADIKHTTTDTFNRDWYKNNRIGIHNNPLFEDDATTTKHNDEWVKYNPNNITITRGEEYTSVTGSDYRYGVPISNNCKIKVETRKTNASTGTLLSIWTYSSNPTSASQLLTFSVTEMGMTQGTFANIEMVVTSSSVTVTNLDNNTTITKEYSTTSNLIMNFWGTTFDYKNFKVCLSDNPTYQEIFENAEYWSKETAGLNEYNNCECEFTYDSNYPLYVLMTGDYPEATNYGYDIGTIKHNTPCIIEKQVYNGREASGNYPVPIEALLDNEEPSVITLSPNESTKGTILYDLPLEDDFGTNEDYAIRGIQVRADIDSTDNLIIYAKIHSPSGEIGQRSIVLNGNEEEIIIGGLGDLWGFTTLQLTQLDDWEVELSASNLLNSGDSEIVFNNVNITFYLETVEKQQIRVTIDGEDIAYYGAFIEKVDIPEGLETDTSFLTIDGTDTNDAYRQNIREKKIVIEFNLSNCDLETSTNMLRQLTKLFVNEKDQYNRPIPKRLQFTHYPTDYFEYIMEEPFDVETELTDYNVKATLTIPSGTSYSLEDTVTNTVGNANGLAAINPIIHIRPSDSNIQIKEGLSEQSFQMGYAGDWSDYIVEIDCDDRRVYLIKDEDTKVDISKYVDHNSDWFRLSGEFEFEGINCTILTVTFNERW